MTARTKGQEVALWAGVAAFFGSLLAIGIFDVFNPAEWLQYFGALLVAIITGGAVYSKERLGFAKKLPDGSEEEVLVKPPPPPSSGPPPVKKSPPRRKN
jgi:hypothetical protein